MKEYAGKVSQLLQWHNKVITWRNAVTRDGQGCDKTAEEPQLWWGHVLRGVRVTPGSSSDSSLRGSWRMNKAGIHHPAWDESLSTDSLISSLLLWTVGVFHRQEKQFPLEGFISFFFWSNISKVSIIIFFLAIACVLSSRETQRSQSLLHLSPGSPSHVLKAWLQWGIAFPLCKFNVPFFLHLQM